MKQEINFALIKHPVLGEICIHNGLSDELNKLIGTETIQHKDNKPIYSAEIIEDEEGLNIYYLYKMEAENFNIGHKKEGLGSTSYITLYSNRIIENKIKVFKNGILSVTYK